MSEFMSDFVCALCGGTFNKGRPDEEAIAEMEEIFGPVPESERAIICDDCYQKIHPARAHPSRSQKARKELQKRQT